VERFFVARDSSWREILHGERFFVERFSPWREGLQGETLAVERSLQGETLAMERSLHGVTLTVERRSPRRGFSNAISFYLLITLHDARCYWIFTKSKANKVPSEYRHDL
jgi:hypothetical protein